MQEQELRLQVCLLDLLDTLYDTVSVCRPCVLSSYLHLDIQDARPALVCNVLDGLYACSIEVAAELCMLNEAIVVYQVLEFLLGDKVVFDAILLAATRCSRCVRDGETESIWILLE